MLQFVAFYMGLYCLPYYPSMGKRLICCIHVLTVFIIWNSKDKYSFSSLFKLLCNYFLCPQRNFGRHIVIALSVRPSVSPSVRPSGFRVRSISPIYFEVGIPILVCGYILGWRSVAYHFRVTVTLTLTSDLVFIIILSGAYLLYYLR